jgi:hypothetical protein
MLLINCRVLSNLIWVILKTLVKWEPCLGVKKPLEINAEGRRLLVRLAEIFILNPFS